MIGCLCQPPVKRNHSGASKRIVLAREIQSPQLIILELNSATQQAQLQRTFVQPTTNVYVGCAFIRLLYLVLHAIIASVVFTLVLGFIILLFSKSSCSPHFSMITASKTTQTQNRVPLPYILCTSVLAFITQLHAPTSLSSIKHLLSRSPARQWAALVSSDCWHLPSARQQMMDQHRRADQRTNHRTTTPATIAQRSARLGCCAHSNAEQSLVV